MSTPVPNITFDLIAHARTQPTAPALIRAGKDVSYRELDTMVWRVAQYLHDEGVRAGQVVALTFQSEFFLALSLLALTRLGATTFTVRKSATAYEIDRWFAAVKPSFMLADMPITPRQQVPAIPFAPDRMNTIGQVQFNILNENPTALLAIHVGSGSTGQPKLIPQTHAHMRARFAIGDSTKTLQPTSRSLCLSSLEFTFIQSCFFHALHLGASHHMNDNINGQSIRDVLLLNRINTLRLSVFHAETLLRAQPHTSTHLFPGIETISIGGSTVSPQLREKISRQISNNLHVTYGTNEFGPISVATSPSVFTEIATVGQPIRGVALEIVDESGQRLPHGQNGLIRVKSPASSGEYLNDPEQTQHAFRQGWFYPGDMGRLTAQGELIHLGRSDQMMIYNGINIYPTEIEACLSEHPGVKEVVAFPLPDDVHQDIPVCAVTLRSDTPPPSPATLISFAKDRLGFKAPKQVFVLSSIPRTDMGKVIRAQLLQQIQQG